MKILLTSAPLKQCIDQMAESIAASFASFEDLLFIGVQTRGVALSKRVAKYLEAKHQVRLPLGTLDINLYRDDFSSMKKIPTVQKTEIPGDVEGKGILLFDEVLYTGRTIRSAMDALMDLGRPKFIKLAILVDRGGRELPIQPDFLGVCHKIGPKQEIQVRFREIDGEEEVRVRE